MTSSVTKEQQGPYYVQTFWSPDRKYLVIAHATPGGIITLQDDNGREWEATGPQQDINADCRLCHNQKVVNSLIPNQPPVPCPRCSHD